MAFTARPRYEGEQVVADIRPHWWPLAGPVLAAAAVVAGGAVAASYGAPHAVGVAVAAVVAAAVIRLLLCYARWSRTHLVLTTDRLVHRAGRLARRPREIDFATVRNVIVRQSRWQRMLRAGDVVVETGAGSRREIVAWVPRPGDVQAEITRLLAPPGGRSVADELEHLDQLRRRGVLSRRELRDQKQRVLRR